MMICEFEVCWLYFMMNVSFFFFCLFIYEHQMVLVSLFLFSHECMIMNLMVSGFSFFFVL